jgi:hypothetical protein
MYSVHNENLGRCLAAITEATFLTVVTVIFRTVCE